MGLEPRGWKVVFANDYSPRKYAMYRGFFPDAPKHYVLEDIFKLDPTTVPRTDLATCSFPCIDLSLAGNMAGVQGKHSSAFWGFIQVLKRQGTASPPLLLVENVPGWLHSNDGGDFEVTVKAINKLGYACDVFTLDALRFAPQSRPRVFLVAARPLRVRGGLTDILARPSSLLPPRLRECLMRNARLGWFSSEIPEPPPLLTGGLSGIVEAMSDSDPRWWLEHQVQRHLSMMEYSHRLRVERLAGGDRFAYRTFFRRRRNGTQRAEVRDDDVAGCLRTAVGGSGKQFLIRGGRGTVKMRAMTPREYARLQGVPDQYPIAASGVQALTGFGDAVCVPAISWIAANVLNPLAETLYSAARAQSAW